MASLDISNDELYEELGFMLGISRDRTKWDSVTTKDVDRVMRSGRRRFFTLHKWKFLQQLLVFETPTPFSTSTVTVASGVVTLTAGIFPANATDYVFAPDNGGVYSIKSRDSDTQLTLDDTSLQIATTDEYKLYQNRYDLPANFGGWEGPISVGQHQRGEINETFNLPDYTLRAFANRERAKTGRPLMFSVTSATDAETGIATYKMLLYPLPDRAYTFTGEYRIAPGDALSVALSDSVAAAVFAECYRECILAAAETMVFDQAGAHTQRLQPLVQKAIATDNAMAGVRHGRSRRRKQPLPSNYELLIGNVAINDQAIT